MYGFRLCEYFDTHILLTQKPLSTKNTYTAETPSEKREMW
jgi:hypothetical protein